MTKTTLTVTLLSDLHIGTGTKLLHGIDWLTYRNGFTYIADDTQLMNTILDRAQADGQNEFEVIEAITGMRLGDLIDAGWLVREDFEADSKLFLYRLKGEPTTNEIREQLKSVYGKPYLPGSSLKGAIRTILATVAAKEMSPSLDNLGNRRTWAAQPVEAELFGKGGSRINANQDLGRAIQIGDSNEVDFDSLRMRRTHVYPTASNNRQGYSRGVDIDLETIIKGTQFTLSLNTPNGLLENRHTPFDERRQQELNHWPQRAKWLENLAKHGREYARNLLIQEVTYFEPRRDVPAVHAFYDEMVTRFTKLKKNQFMLQLGWGGGWHTKTLNEYVKKDARRFEEIISQYRLDPTGDRKVGEIFPKSRHLLRRSDGKLAEAIGWCQIEIDDVSK
ncbi:MAG: type III-A CRISPR-associated RAMP protein Csm5 [Chloroflexota bacterium]